MGEGSRALVLVLLRTGMRIGELLGLKMIDLDVRGRKIHIYEGEKNSLGRVLLAPLEKSHSERANNGGSGFGGYRYMSNLVQIPSF